MRISVTADDQLVAKALKLTGIEQKSALVRVALKFLIARESARRLALLGGSEPNAVQIPRRRSPI
jgi:Arc/MetJ family transcription regulator